MTWRIEDPGTRGNFGIAATPAMAAGTCQALPATTKTSTTITAKKPCGNLSAKYRFAWKNADGTSREVTRTVVPLGSTTFSFGTSHNWSLSVE
ncbi:MAG: hypothetical protein ACOH1J_09195 [Microbacteriaceae bacterium]